MKQKRHLINATIAGNTNKTRFLASQIISNMTTFALKDLPNVNMRKWSLTSTRFLRYFLSLSDSMNACTGIIQLVVKHNQTTFELTHEF